MTEEEFEEKYKEVIDIINNTRTSLMVEDFVEEMYLKIKQQQKEIEQFYKEININTEIHKRDIKIKELKEVIQCLHETDKEFISKDKIKQKIKELEKEKTEVIHELDFKGFYTLSQLKDIEISILNELLEE